MVFENSKNFSIIPKRLLRRENAFFPSETTQAS